MLYQCLTVVVNDSVLQASDPFRHAVVQARIAMKLAASKTVFMKFTDGGTDQRNNLQSVVCKHCFVQRAQPGFVSSL